MDGLQGSENLLKLFAKFLCMCRFFFFLRTVYCFHQILKDLTLPFLAFSIVKSFWFILKDWELLLLLFSEYLVSCVWTHMHWTLTRKHCKLQTTIYYNVGLFSQGITILSCQMSFLIRWDGLFLPRTFFPWLLIIQVSAHLRPS